MHACMHACTHTHGLQAAAGLTFELVLYVIRYFPGPRRRVVRVVRLP